MGKNKINISIDDVSPHPLSSVKVLDRCFELIEELPEIKFTLFIPFAYWRTSYVPGKADTRSERPFALHNFPDFCNTIKNLPAKNFELGYHGLFHGIPGHSNNDEFKYLSYEDAVETLKRVREVESKSGLMGKFAPIFRPPAWKLSPGSFKACSQFGIEIFALSEEEYALDVYSGEHLNHQHLFFDCSPPNFPLQVKKTNEIVYHACEWDVNYLNKEKTKDLKDFILSQGEVNFCFMEEML